MAPYEIVLYGANTYINCSAASLVCTSDLATITDLVSCEIECFFINPQWKDDGEQYQAGSVKYKDGLRRATFEIQTDYYEFPDDDATIQAIEEVLNKKYHWVEVTDFPRQIHDDNLAVSVVIEDKLNLENYGKQFNINCEYTKNV